MEPLDCRSPRRPYLQANEEEHAIIPRNCTHPIESSLFVGRVTGDSEITHFKKAPSPNAPNLHGPEVSFEETCLDGPDLMLANVRGTKLMGPAKEVAAQVLNCGKVRADG